MAIISVDVNAVISGSLVHLYITRNDEFIKTNLFFEEVNSQSKFVNWLVDQKGTQQTSPSEINRRFDVELNSGSLVGFSSSRLPKDIGFDNLPSEASLVDAMTNAELKNVVRELVRYIKNN